MTPHRLQRGAAHLPAWRSRQMQPLFITRPLAGFLIRSVRAGPAALCSYGIGGKITLSSPSPSKSLILIPRRFVQIVIRGHLTARQQRRQAKIGGVCPDSDGLALLVVQADRVYLPSAGIIRTKHYSPAIGREGGIHNASQTRSCR